MGLPDTSAIVVPTIFFPAETATEGVATAHITPTPSYISNVMRAHTVRAAEAPRLPEAANEHQFYPRHRHKCTIMTANGTTTSAVATCTGKPKHNDAAGEIPNGIRTTSLAVLCVSFVVWWHWKRVLG